MIKIVLKLSFILFFCQGIVSVCFSEVETEETATIHRSAYNRPEGDFIPEQAVIDRNEHPYLSAERHQTVIDPIIHQLLDQSPNINSRNPTLLFLGGSPGAGKSHVLRHLKEQGDLNLQDFVVIDPDAIKLLLPEFTSISNVNIAGTLVHEESMYIAELLLEAALRRNKNIIFDASLGYLPFYESLLKRISFKNPSYHRKLLFVQTTLETALRRNIERVKTTKRYVPPEKIRSIHITAQDNFFKLSKFFSEKIIIKNETTPQILSIQNEDGWYLAGNKIFNSIHKIKSETSLIKRTFNIVFDLDWTVVYSIRENKTGMAHLVFDNNESYRFTDAVRDIIDLFLMYPGVKVSFASGGSIERNERLLKGMILPSKRNGFEIAYQIRSYNDLKRRKNVPETAHFAFRWRKDVAQFDEYTKDTLVAEDSPEFFDPSQQENVVWIGPAYEYVDSVKQLENQEFRKNKVYLPKDSEALESERYKMITTAGAMFMMLDLVYTGKAKNLIEARQMILGDPKIANSTPLTREQFSIFSSFAFQRLIEKFPDFKLPIIEGVTSIRSCRNVLL